MNLDDILSLAEAGELLEISPETLRTQWRRGRFGAKLIGNTLVTTRDEVERYRAASLNRPGRPRVLDKIAWKPNRAVREEVWLLGYADTPDDIAATVADAIRDSVAAGAATVKAIKEDLSIDPRTADLILMSGETPPYIGMAHEIHDDQHVPARKLT